MINRTQELLQSKPKKNERRKKADVSENAKKIKPDTGNFVVNFSSNIILCRNCGEREYFAGKFMTDEISKQVKTFKLKHTSCKK